MSGLVASDHPYKGPPQATLSHLATYDVGGGEHDPIKTKLQKETQSIAKNLYLSEFTIQSIAVQERTLQFEFYCDKLFILILVIYIFIRNLFYFNVLDYFLIFFFYFFVDLLFF